MREQDDKEVLDKKRREGNGRKEEGQDTDDRGVEGTNAGMRAHGKIFER